MMDGLPLSEDYSPLSGDSDTPQSKPKKGSKTQKRVIVLLTVVAACGFISLAGNKTGITKRFNPNVPVAESAEIVPMTMTVEPTRETSTEADDNSGDFQPSPDLEMVRNELLDKSLNEVGFQVNNLSEAVAETFLLQARSEIEKKPVSIELFLIQKINFLANKLDKATLEGEFNGSPKERQKAADLLFEVWGNLLALKRHWETTAADQIQLKFTTVNVSILASDVRRFSEVAMKLRALTYEQQKRTEALQKQLELEAKKQAALEARKDAKTK
jgi:macrodomain Ter protein organizer (MatP/YcbG family)